MPSRRCRGDSAERCSHSGVLGGGVPGHRGAWTARWELLAAPAGQVCSVWARPAWTGASSSILQLGAAPLASAVGTAVLSPCPGLRPGTWQRQAPKELFPPEGSAQCLSLESTEENAGNSHSPWCCFLVRPGGGGRGRAFFPNWRSGGLPLESTATALLAVGQDRGVTAPEGRARPGTATLPGALSPRLLDRKSVV